MNNLYNKKSNIKSFFKKIRQYNLLQDFFIMNNINNLPMDNLQNESGYENVYDFYLSLESDIRRDIKLELEKIIFISNFTANKIANSFSSTETTHSIIADNYQEKSLAFYLDNFDLVNTVVNIYSFYKVSGWKRFEAKGQATKENILLSDIKDQWIERYSEKYFEDNKTHINILDSNIYFYDNKYFAFIDIADDVVGRVISKRIYIVFLPEIAEVMIKMSGNFVEVFSMAEMFMKKLANVSIDMSEEKYNFDIILSDMFNNIDDNDNNSNILLHHSIMDWRIKSLNVKNNENILNLKFNKNPNSKYFNDLIIFSKNYNLNFVGFDIDNMSFDIQMIIAGIDVIKKRISLNLKKNKSNLNLLKQEHLSLHKILKEKGIFEGFVNISV